MNPFEQVNSLLEQHKKNKENEKMFQATVVRVMSTVGGYDQFMRLPIPVFQEVVKGLQELDRIEMEKQKALMGGKSKGTRGTR